MNCFATTGLLSLSKFLYHSTLSIISLIYYKFLLLCQSMFCLVYDLTFLKYLLKTSITHNEKRIALLYLLTNCKLARSPYLIHKR